MTLFKCTFAVALLLSLSLHAAQKLDLKAPNLGIEPHNQRRSLGNSCGPACLLNSFSHGSWKWQAPIGLVKGHNSQKRIAYVIQEWGNRPSRWLKGRHRWNKSQGVNLRDLLDMAQEMCAPYNLPPLTSKSYYYTGGSSSIELLRQAHQNLKLSLEQGHPPIISIRLHEQIVNPKSTPRWAPVRGHFVIITAMPSRLHRRAKYFPIQYLDPWGGITCQGTIAARNKKGATRNFPSLIANFPQSHLNKMKGKPLKLPVIGLAGSINVQ